MATKRHIPNGEYEQPVGAAKEQAKALWAAVNTQASWDATTTANKLEFVRKFIKYALMRWFGAV